MKIVQVALLIVATLLPINAFAVDAYKCQIASAVQVSSEGNIVEDKLFSALVGEEFIVDRDTGRMNGAIKNHGLGGQPEVLDAGSSEQAYKVITVYGPMTSINLLYVEEFAESSVKPFSFTEGLRIVSGTCVAY